jgi:NAD(P)H-hydrate epimerase
MVPPARVLKHHFVVFYFFMTRQIIDKSIVKQLRLPKPNSRKRDNGRLLIIAGSDKYFGALVYAVKTASRLVDLVYVLTTKENQKLIEKMKLKTAEFMPVNWPINGHATKQRSVPIHQLLSDIDVVLIGPGMGISANTKRLVLQTLKSNKKALFDADALNVLDDKLKKLLSPLHILTPHHKEFYRLFKIDATAQNASEMAKKWNCHIVLKGPIDVIAQPNGKIALNKTGNAGMTKGGTGDVLAGLIAALYSTNNAFTSAAAGVYINGTAGDELYKKVGTFYDAEDLTNQLPKTLWHLVSLKK